MWDNCIGAQIRRANRNLLIVNGGLLLLIAFFAGASERCLGNFFAGSRPLSARTLAATPNPDTLRRYYVTVEGDKAFDTEGGQRLGQGCGRPAPASGPAAAVDRDGV